MNTNSYYVLLGIVSALSAIAFSGAQKIDEGNLSSVLGGSDPCGDDAVFRNPKKKCITSHQHPIYPSCTTHEYYSYQQNYPDSNAHNIETGNACYHLVEVNGVETEACPARDGLIDYEDCLDTTPAF